MIIEHLLLAGAVAGYVTLAGVTYELCEWIDDCLGDRTLAAVLWPVVWCWSVGRLMVRAVLRRQ